MLGIDGRWCVTGDGYQKLSPRPFPEWMYRQQPVVRLRRNVQSVCRAGSRQDFGVLTGLKQEDMGRDGYTVSFRLTILMIPPAPRSICAKLNHVFRAANVPAMPRGGAFRRWRPLRDDLLSLPAKRPTRSCFSCPIPPAAVGAGQRRSSGLGRVQAPHRRSDKFDAEYRCGGFHAAKSDHRDGRQLLGSAALWVAVADRLALDLTAADRGQASPDYQVLSRREGSVDAGTPAR